MPEGSPHSAPALPIRGCRMPASGAFVSGSLSSSRPRFSSDRFGRWRVFTDPSPVPFKEGTRHIDSFHGGNRISGNRFHNARGYCRNGTFAATKFATTPGRFEGLSQPHEIKGFAQIEKAY